MQEEAQGARRIYYIDPRGLGPLRAWLDQFWDHALEAFRAEAEKEDAPDSVHENIRRAGEEEHCRECAHSRAFDVFAARFDSWWPRDHHSAKPR